MRKRTSSLGNSIYLVLFIIYALAIFYLINFVFRGHGQSCAVDFEPAYVPPDVKDRTWYIDLGWRIGYTATNTTWTMYYYVWNPENNTCTVYFTPLYQNVYKVPDEVEVYTNLTNAFTVSAVKKLVYVKIIPHKEGTFFIGWNVSGVWNWHGPHVFVVHSLDPIPPELSITPSYVNLSVNESTNLTISIKNPGTVENRDYTITVSCGGLLCNLSKNSTTIRPQSYDYINLTIFATSQGKYNIIVYAKDNIDMMSNASAIVEVMSAAQNATQNATQNVTGNISVSIYPSTSVQMDKSKSNTTTFYIYITNNMNQTKTLRINIQCPQDILCTYDKDTITLKSGEYGYVKLDVDVSKAEVGQYSILVKVSNNISIENNIDLYVIAPQEKGIVEIIMEYLTKYWYVIVPIVLLLIVSPLVIKR